MPRNQPLARRLATATRWPVGVALTSWRYMWRTTPMHRREEEGRWPEDAPPMLPDAVDHDEVQRVGHGAGPMFHRRYAARIADPEVDARALIGRLCADPNRASPSEFASFKKLRGEEGRMDVGDEYVVRMPGPWDGPVRVIERTPESFRLATLDGHLEAGQIRFSASGSDPLEFTIESWARSGDRLSDLLYDRLRMSKEIQLHMWTSFLERVVGLSGGRRHGCLDIHTRKVEPPEEQPERRLGDEGARRALLALHDRGINFEPPPDDARLADAGWRLDDHCQPLPREAPGEPEPGGSFEVAKRLMRNYEFADPAIVRAIYEEDAELQGRDMLLKARFWGLTFDLGVRVGGVVDETREIRDRQVRVWGWGYRTLTGHLEAGQMDYEVWKWLDSGEVEFRIHAYSRPASIPNPVVRLGFRLFGRRQQLKFARHALRRMECLTQEELGRQTGRPPVERAAETIAVPDPAA
jgi:uncharacterized protein (UPF0548 family)